MLAGNIKEKLNIDNYNFAHLALILLLHYRVKGKNAEDERIWVV